MAAFGLTAVIATWQPAYELIRFGGAMYLAYLGAKMLLSKESSLVVQSAGAPKSGWRLYCEGYVNNLMNPKAIIFSLTFLPQFSNPSRGPVWAQIIVLGVILSIIMLAVVVPIALTSGHFAQWFASRPKAALALSRAMGATLVGLAAWVFQSSRHAR